MNYSYRISQSGNNNNNIYSQSPIDLGLRQITFEKRNQLWLYNKYKDCTAAEPKVILSFVDFKLYNPDITLTFLELSNTNNFNTNNQSFTQLSFQYQDLYTYIVWYQH